MNTAIIKRELITHELKWYWKKPELRKEIRDCSEAGAIEHAPIFTLLPRLSEEQLDDIIYRDTNPLVVRAMAEYTSSDLYALYRSVFLHDDTYAINVEVSPMTDKLDRYVLPYVGVMAVYAIADRMIAAYQVGTLEMSADADLWLRQLRFMAARRLHIFTKKLTRMNADSTPTYGVSINSNRVAQFWLRDANPTEEDVLLAKQTYPGDRISTRLVHATVTPIGITFRDYGRADRSAAPNMPPLANVI